LCAYLLEENKLIGENDEMNAATLPKVRMPNRDNFVVQFPDRI
jgi:S-disulfanyl-L-cysteine oxidoreductase SoxD